MSARSTSDFKVSLLVQAAGPMRPRSKHKKHKLLRAEAIISLPFVPYPGLYLTFTKSGKRETSVTLYLRIRAVEWNVTENCFECVADEVLGSTLFSETYEIRGSARIEQHFIELQKALRVFGFEVDTNIDGMSALHKSADGTVLDDRASIRF